MGFRSGLCAVKVLSLKRGAIYRSLSTPLRPAVEFVLVDVKFAYSCSAIKGCAMKLLVHSLCADVNTISVLEVCSYGISTLLTTFTFALCTSALTVNTAL